MDAGSILAAAHTLAVDRVTAEIVGALDGAGIESVVLKGPALARRLYREGELRAYGDSDILVSPGDHALAGRVLADAGFRMPEPGAYRDRIEPHAINLARPRDRANVDLHRTLPLVAADPQEVWEAFRGGAERMRVGGADVLVPGPDALAFHVALHEAHHGVRSGRRHADLRRALERFDDATWRAAYELAQRLGAADAFIVGLEFEPAGRALAERLGARAARSSATLLAAQSPPSTARGWHRLLTARDRRERARALRAALLPPPSYIRWWWGYRPRPRMPLPVMYAWRYAHMAREAPAAVSAVLRARRRVG
ncbi:MAG TPA: nucleotidyltransferase family protein [Solirubrobacteraceae bacterium]|nr:nucleotidyltransferase family protein [Solirubrobacteraceae bacterium]